jgi:hypothetical protein
LKSTMGLRVHLNNLVLPKRRHPISLDRLGILE